MLHVAGCEVCLLLKFVLHCSGVLQQFPGAEQARSLIISLVAFSGMSIYGSKQIVSVPCV